MSKRRSRIITIFIAVIAIASSVIATIPLLTQDAFADAAAENRILKITLLKGIRTCYNTTYMKESLKGTEYNGGKSLVTSKGNNDGIIRVPNMVGNTLGDADISCEQLFDGYREGKSTNSIKGLNSLFGKKPQLTDLGYSRNTTNSSNGTSQNCIWYTYTYSKNGINAEGSTERICFEVSNNHVNTADGYLSIVVSGDADSNISYSGQTGPVTLWYDYSQNYVHLSTNTTNGGTSDPTEVALGYNPSWDTVYSKMDAYADEIRNARSLSSDGASYQPYSKVSLESSTGSGDVYETYTQVDFGEGALIALRYYTGDPKATWISNATFNSADVYVMYSSYFNQAIKNHPDVLSRAADDKCTDTNNYEYALYNGSKWCELTGVENITDIFNGVNMNNVDYWEPPLIEMSFADIVKGLGMLNYDLIEAEGGVVDGLDGLTINNGSSGGASTASDTSTLALCYNGTGALGWIACPVIELAGNAMGFLYDKFVEPALEIRADDIMSRETGVYVGWSTFRDIANIIFVIFFIVIILSQLTGIGINNYGIKKILPRFIIVVVLVNMSFIICQLAVDLSNLLGVGLRALFLRLPIAQPYGTDVEITAGSIAGGILTSIGLVSGTVAAIQLPVVAATLRYWIPLILVAFLGCLISVFFFFITLGVRQAGVAILVVLAPLAIICYALPNTKSLFDKWKKLFTALLMVYPICGLLMGGGEYAGALLMSIDTGGEMGFFYTITAMLMSVVPFLFIPSILKNSMALMGNIGTRLSNFGKTFGKGVTGAIRRSQYFQDRQQEAQRNLNMARNKRIMGRTKLDDTEQARLAALRDKLASGAKLSSNERSELRSLSSRQYRHARAAAGSWKLNQEDAMAEAWASRGSIEPGSDGYKKMVSDMTRMQRNKDDAGQVALYEDGKVQALDGSGVVRADSLASLKKEHAELLKRTALDPENEALNSRMRAVQTMLGKMGPNGFDAMEDNFGELMHNNGGFKASGADRRGVDAAAAHLTRNFAGQIKANSRSLDDMLKSINNGDYSKMDTFKKETYTDATGKNQTRYMSGHFGSKGAQSIKAENVNDLGDAYYDNLLRATINGDLKGNDLEQVLKVFDEAEELAAAGKLSLKGEVEQRIKAIKNAAYASSQSSGGSRSEGSRMIGAAGSAGIDSIVKQIANAKNWGAMTTTEQQTYSDLVNNITDSLKQDAHTAENVQQLQSALADAKTKGIRTAVTGGTLIDQVSTVHAIKVPRGSKRAVTMPTGWSLTPSGWVDGSGAPLSAEDAVKAQQILEHNNSIDIQNGQV